MNNLKYGLLCFWPLLIFQVGRYNGWATALVEQEFTPTVTATCKAGYMTIKVTTNQPYIGAVHTKDFRTPECMTYGNGGQVVQLDINLHAPQKSPDYCGVFLNNRTEERSVPIAIRVHRTLELADDKFYVITCGKSGFKNAQNETSLVALKVLDNANKRVQEVVYGHQYTLRAEVSKPDGIHGVRVKSCFAFGKGNKSVALINERGCPINPRVISPFEYDASTGYANSILYSMFRLQDSVELHFQCDISICKGACPTVSCNTDYEPASLAQLAGAKEIFSDSTTTGDEGIVPASTTVFVLDPGDPNVSTLCSENTINPPWLLYLCVALGLLFLMMLIINIFLCTAMTCTCARTEVIEKEPSIIEEYDPYRSWHGSQYGSRYSLNGKPGYVSGGSTMNSTRSMSTNSDHYAIVHSRPGSRYSPSNGLSQKQNHLRTPVSHIGSHYSNKL